MDRYEDNGRGATTLTETAPAAEAPAYAPVEHWSYQVETPFLPVNEIMELAENEATLEQETWSANADQVAFREAVLAAHIALRSKGGKRKPFADLPQSALAKIAGTDKWMRSDAAEAVGRLLTDARQALSEAQNAGDADAKRTRGLGATSGYRSPKHQYELWRGYFPKDYAKTEQARLQAIGGEHGPAARQIALKETAQWIAAPGFSNHNSGIAIDFAQIRTPKSPIKNSSDATALARWRTTWFYKWLLANAANYGFQPYVREPWHWEYKPTPARDPEEFDEAEDPGRFESESGYGAEGLDEGLDYEETSFESQDESQLDEYMSARDLEQAELDEGELATEPEAEEWFGMPFVPTAPASVPAPTTAAPSRNPALVASCLPALKSIQSVQATFQSQRRAAIDEIVLHDTSSARGRKFKDAVKYLAKPGDGRQVSIHYFIGRDEGEIVSMVPELKRAWHVAAAGHNKRAVGIELFQRKGEGTGGVPAFTDWQYRAVSQLVYDLMLRHKVKPAGVIAHAWVQSNRGDPKGFDWTRFGQMLGQIADCARGVDPSLVVADAASAGERGRTGTKGAVKEFEDLSDFGEFQDFEEELTDSEDEAGEAVGLFEDEGFGDESESEDGEGEEYDVTESLDEDRLLDEFGEESLDTYEAPVSSAADRVVTALKQKLWSGAAALMIGSGMRDEKRITGIIFRSRHPELAGRAIRPDEKALAAEWIAIRDRVVRPLIGARVAPAGSASGQATQVRLKPVKSGYAAYGGGRLDARLRDLKSKGQLTISERDIDTLQRVADVESSGLANALNTWDNAVVSIAFKQWTLRWGELQDLISRAPAAFERHGIRLAKDGSMYTFRSRTKSWQRPAIDGVPNAETLRNEDWSRRFYLASLEPEAIVAAAQKALEEIATLEAKVRKQYGWSPHLNSPRGRALLVELHNNRPAYIRDAVPRTLARAGTDSSEDQFLKVFVEEIVAAYTNRENDATKGRRWTGRIMGT